mmetsp:Transcript_53982/g.155845  ORF Transcript_53982/g.155845 Transcript_53982/m.155845 type:complete len:530 (+) Transcript_53982:107-1696(+)
MQNYPCAQRGANTARRHEEGFAPAVRAPPAAPPYRRRGALGLRPGRVPTSSVPPRWFTSACRPGRNPRSGGDRQAPRRLARIRCNGTISFHARERRETLPLRPTNCQALRGHGRQPPARDNAMAQPYNSSACVAANAEPALRGSPMASAACNCNSACSGERKPFTPRPFRLAARALAARQTSVSATETTRRSVSSNASRESNGGGIDTWPLGTHFASVAESSKQVRPSLQHQELRKPRPPHRAPSSPHTGGAMSCSGSRGSATSADKHCEYHGFCSRQASPAMQQFAPSHPWPPHCSHSWAQHDAQGVGCGTGSTTGAELGGSVVGPTDVGAGSGCGLGVADGGGGGVGTFGPSSGCSYSGSSRPDAAAPDGHTPLVLPRHMSSSQSWNPSCGQALVLRSKLYTPSCGPLVAPAMPTGMTPSPTFAPSSQTPTLAASPAPEATKSTRRWYQVWSMSSAECAHRFGKSSLMKATNRYLPSPFSCHGGSKPITPPASVQKSNFTKAPISSAPFVRKENDKLIGDPSARHSE